MKALYVILSLVVGCLLWKGGWCVSECTNSKPCKCSDTNFSVDFGEVGETLAQSNITVGKYKYYISLCSSVKCNASDSGEATAAGCQYQMDDNDPTVVKTVTKLGEVGKHEWRYTNESSFYVFYSGGDSYVEDGQPVVRRLQVLFNQKDVDKPDVEFIEEDKKSDKSFDSYVFLVHLNSKEEHEGVKAGAGTVLGLAGLIIIILLFISIIAYFIIGSVVMYKVRGARGAEIIPNYSFWKDLPILIKDGCIFTFSPCHKKLTGYQPL